MRTSTLFSAKTSDFSKFLVRPNGQGGWTSADKGEEDQFFVILCRRLLWTAPKETISWYKVL